jgi:hypothetical protein
MQKTFLLFTLALSFTLSVCAQGNGASITPQGGTVKIKISGGREFIATLVKNSSTAVLLDMLKA